MNLKEMRQIAARYAEVQDAADQIKAAEETIRAIRLKFPELREHRRMSPSTRKAMSRGQRKRWRLARKTS